MTEAEQSDEHCQSKTGHKRDSLSADPPNVAAAGKEPVNALCGRGSRHMRERIREPVIMKYRILVTLKPGVLDPQGKAIHHALEGLGFDGVDDVRAGKLIELEVADSVGQPEIEEMCRKLLANTVIENFRIEAAEPARA